MLKLLYNVFSKVGKQTNFGRNYMSESAKVVNYTEEMVATITSEYEANPVRSTVDSLAERFDKSPRSIIAKLSALGIYQKAERVTKRGEPVVKKVVLRQRCERATGP